MNFQYLCSECGRTFAITPELMLCPSCSKDQKKNEPLRGVLEVLLEGKASENFDSFDLLPVEKEYFPAIPVGNTALWEPKNIRLKTGIKSLYIKDDGMNPTSSFKDRASFLVAAFAIKHNIRNIVLASTGNAGSSMAGIGAAAGIQITLFLPKTAPQAKLVQSMQYGAKLILADGNYDMAYDLSLEYTKQKGGMNRNTAYNPMTIEGKKTVSLEMFKNLGNKAPDIVFVSVGDGVILSGVYKGFRDLKKLGLINKIPTIYCVQAEGSDAITRAMETGKFEMRPTQTVADSICVDVPRNGYLAVKNLKEYGGKCVRVSDQEIIKVQKDLATSTGLFTEPAGATAMAGFYKVQHELDKNATIVIMTTGNGLKDTASAMKGLPPMPKPIKSISEIK